MQLRRGFDGSASAAPWCDSYAGHWRGALDVVAQSKGWRGLSITHSSCPLQKALRDLREPRRTHCRRWKRDVFAWFAAHPEVETVFVAGLTGGSGVVARPGRSRFDDVAVQSYARRRWRALPATCGRIVVIRDTPKHGRAITAHLRAAVVDAGGRPARAARARISRGRALDRDRRRWRQRRGSPRRANAHGGPHGRFVLRLECYPVVGGALVLRDTAAHDRDLDAAAARSPLSGHELRVERRTMASWTTA